MSKIAILGFGTVGSGVYEVVCTNAQSIARKAGSPIEVKYIVDIRDFPDHPQASLFTKDFADVLNDPEVDIVVEVIGGIQPAYTFTKSALEAGKSVVTSNKELVATHGHELLLTAKEHGVSYLFEASVGGGIPIIKPLNECLAANQIHEIAGILNGTTNYILTQMIKEGKDFSVALKDAQEKGYAEANPAADVDGIDACRKIAILTSLAFGKQVDSQAIHTEGISRLTLTDVSYADKLGYVIKLIGYGKKVGEQVLAYVAPMFVPKDHSLAIVNDVFNAILVNGNAIGDVMFYGRGAGKLPTASAVVADIIDIAKGTASNPYWTKADEGYLAPYHESRSRYFLRIPSSKQAQAQDRLKNTEFISLMEGEVGALTETMSVTDLHQTITGLDPIQVIRTLPEKEI